jgi:putative transposase
LLIFTFSRGWAKIADQGSQFTSDSFTGMLLNNGITISMDGRGRALDNIFVERLWRTVKYEEIYLKKHDRLQDLIMGLTSYFLFYNEERRHQALDYQTPSLVYQTAKGGGAMIVDKFNCAKEALTPSAEEEGQRHSAVI